MTHTPRLRAATGCAAVLTALALASCGTSTPAAPPQTTTPLSTTTATSSAPTTSAAPTESESAPASADRSEATLKKALLAEEDVPSGFSVSSDDSKGDSPKSSSTNPKCAEFNKLMNLDAPPGSKASAHVTIDGGQSGPSIDQSLDALPNAAAVKALTARLKAAVKACPSVNLTIPGAPASKMTVTSVTAPAYGASPAAARLTGQGGALDGLEVTFVWTGLDDVLMTMSFINSAPEDVDGATGSAHDKAAQVLGVTASSVS